MSFHGITRKLSQVVKHRQTDYVFDILEPIVLVVKEK